MKEVLTTSSALILALLGLRLAFRKSISRRVQYALWALVLARLLVPVNLPAADFSVLTAAAPVIGAEEDQTLYLQPVQQTISAPEDASPLLAAPSDARFAAMGPPSSDNTRTVTDENQVTRQTKYRRQIDLGAVLRPIWYGGMAVMVLWLAGSNLRFRRMLQKRRIPLELPDCKRPAYLVEEGLVSPCLFGLFRPAVYLTPAVLEDREGLRHVLAHEEAHARQGDPLWALLRGVCLAVYWFDPLVWLAARAAKEDCELSCDELALRALGEEERVPYGRTLLRLIPVKGSARDALLTATTMTSDKRRLKERIARIAEGRKMKRAALLAALTAAAVVCAVTFTGCVTAEPSARPDVPAAPEADAPEPPAPSDASTPPADTDGSLSEEGPALTIPLAGLMPYEPIPVEVLPAETPSPGHHGEKHHQETDDRHRLGGGCHTTDRCGTFAWSCGGNVYVSSHDLLMSSYPSDYFLCFPEQEYQEEEFTGLFGYDGVRISYHGDLNSYEYGPINDYYVFEEGESGTAVYLLARVYGTPQMIDLDGDGVMELVSGDFGWGLVFQRDGLLYNADVGSLLQEHWPEASYMEPYGWDAGGRYLTFLGLVPDGESPELQVTAWRRAYFDGENLLVYGRRRDAARHMALDLQAPAAVADAAREVVRAEFEARRDNAGAEDRPAWDDYCVTDLRPAYPAEGDLLPEGLDVAVYRLGYEFHTSAPEQVVLAGGIYVDEDGWVGGFGADSPGYLLFRRLEDGTCVYLDSMGCEAGPGSPAFARRANEILAAHDLPQIPVPAV
jgi:beta-lactamase regulating signal transducer with metallopeptidase domain